MTRLMKLCCVTKLSINYPRTSSFQTHTYEQPQRLSPSLFFFFLNDPPPPKLPPLPLPDLFPIPPQRQAFTDSAQKKPVPPQLRETRDLVAQALATPGEPDQRG